MTATQERNDLPEGGALTSTAWLDPAGDHVTTHAVFEGDEGGLDVAARRALVVLMKNRFLSAQSHPDEWRALTANAADIRGRLNDMFLALRLDLEREVAYKYQVTGDTGARFPTLLHATEWTREETILMVHLRSVARATRAGGQDRVFVDRYDLLEHVASLRPANATDVSGDRRKATRAIDQLNSAGLLIGRKGADRFEVAAAVDVLLPLETLKQLLTWIQTEPQPTAEPETHAEEQA